MRKYILIFGLIFLVSCKPQKKDSSKHFNLKTINNQETIIKRDSTIKTEVEKDTLFSDFYDKMPLEKLRKKPQDYYFICSNDSVKFEINYRLNNFKLDTLILVKKGVVNQKDFNCILNLYKEKYGKYKLSKKIINVLFRENYGIKHIYWNNQFKSNFFYSKDIHKNYFYLCDVYSKSFCCLQSHNSSNLSKYGYHIHAKNKQTNQDWVFEVDVKKLKDEFAKYELKSYLFKDSAKKIELQTFKLINKVYHKHINPLLFSIAINQEKDLPSDYMKIKYYIKIADNTYQQRIINADSLKKVQLKKNKSDI